MEGLLLEVPVIASRARGSRELVDDQTGITFEIGNVAALAAAMDHLVDDPDAAREMGRRGRIRMVDQYEISKLVPMHDQMYHAMLAERKANVPGSGKRSSP